MRLAVVVAGDNWPPSLTARIMTSEFPSRGSLFRRKMEFSGAAPRPCRRFAITMLIARTHSLTRLPRKNNARFMRGRRRRRWMFFNRGDILSISFLISDTNWRSARRGVSHLRKNYDLTSRFLDPSFYTRVSSYFPLIYDNKLKRYAVRSRRPQ